MAMSMVVYCRHHHGAKRAQMINKPPPRRAEGTRRQGRGMTVLDSLLFVFGDLSSVYLPHRASKPIGDAPVGLLVYYSSTALRCFALGSGGTSAGTRWSFLTYIHVTST
jgi:hypothetical protein